MENKQQIPSLSIPELVLGVQSCTNSNDRISFRTNECFHELVRRCIAERGLSSEAEFFERLAKDYFGRIGWMPREKKTPQYLTWQDLGFKSEHDCNIAEKRISFRQKELA
jgi:hypothetical protein